MEINYKELAEAIAAHLGATVELIDEMSKTRFYVTLAGGERFFIGFDLYNSKGKVTISCAYPFHVSSTEGNKAGTIQRDFDTSLSYRDSGLDSIFISMSKAPEVIARDIERRFLKEYRALYFKAVAYCASKAEYYATTKDNEKVIKEAYRGISGAHVMYVNGNSVKLELYSVSIEHALKLAEFLKSL